MKITGATRRERHAKKLAIGWAVAERNGCMSDFADALGVSRVAVTNFLKMYPDLRRALIDGRRKSSLSDRETAERTLMCAQVRLGRLRWCDAARAFNVSRAGLYGWAERHEDEILECMAELEPPPRRIAA